MFRLVQEYASLLEVPYGRREAEKLKKIYSFNQVKNAKEQHLKRVSDRSGVHTAFHCKLSAGAKKDFRV